MANTILDIGRLVGRHRREAALPTTEVRWIRGKPGVGEICVQIPSAARPAAVRAAKRAAARRHLARASGS